jgi:GT2 family glycosyltransferase
VSSSTTGVVLVNFGTSDDTLACLDSIELSTNLDMRVVVVDNNIRHDPALDSGVRGRAAILRSGDNIGYAGGNNLGIRKLLEEGCEYLWILNSDTLVQPDTLENLHVHLAARPDCGIVGPRIVRTEDNDKILADGGEVDLKAYGATRHIHAGKSSRKLRDLAAVDVDYVPGTCMLVRRTMIEDVGLLPEKYFMYFEETDWCLRAAASGWRVMVDPSFSIAHHKRPGVTLPKPHYLYYMTRNRYHFAVGCLGLDGEMAFAHMAEVFHAPMRERVARQAPHWVESFDDLVQRAMSDARAGRYGRNDEISNYPDAESQERSC